MLSEPSNFFDSVLDVTTSSLGDSDELNCYLAMEVEEVKDALMWWHERCATFPCLSHMAQNYLSILGKCAIISVISADILSLSDNH
jgi:hypothetical protein